MSEPVRIVLIGDRDENVLAHRAIDASLQLLNAELPYRLEWLWPGTPAVLDEGEALLDDFDGIWCVPASPNRSTAGALAAIRFARERRRPFLGTCGGFRHALLEYARNVLSLASAQHEEESPGAALPFVSRLSCSLVEVAADIVLDADSATACIVGGTRLTEGFHCNYGLNPAHRGLLAASDLRIAGADPAGDARVIELTDHPFFIATLFQPERRALTERRAHALVRAFVQAAHEQRDAR